MQRRQSTLSLTHYFLALLMDGVFKHHSKSDPEIVLSNADTEKLFKAVIGAVKKETDYKNSDLAPDPEKVRFAPCMAETLSVVYQDFDQTERLKDIPRQFRTHLFIDPVRLRLLAAEGLDTGNPFLLFVFDATARDGNAYAHGLAPKWTKTMSLIDQRFGLESLEAIDQTGEIIPATGDGVRFGAFASKSGMQRIAAFMATLQQQGVSSVLRTDDYAYVQQIGWATRIDVDTDEADLPDEREPSEFRTVADLFEAEEARGDTLPAITAIKFSRQANHDEAGNVLAYEKTLRPILEKILSAAENIADLPDEEAVTLIATTYLDCEFLHPKPNGNYRLFGLLMLNLLLAKAALPFSVIDDPNVSDGASVEEVAGMIRAGMETCRQWQQAG